MIKCRFYEWCGNEVEDENDTVCEQCIIERGYSYKE